ncbi:MAG: 50S ribosomal protein L15 [Candidatus Magasanikbacteria bacterium]|uniref:Large ribosomal subunit protein uL15 n=1 Tax=Candidatus Magasanikbacteria bacterium CG10_big_fil_rev_8_21_14_0_10_38_6 TaxID=1974647 RepID=A0A2M6P0R5_9BACT|nr:50S ribosomal protein L15 [Candidatus Magasanikbacteria bacterium]NCS71904.1 50S ribosomal protein L15 [Candidatus Magasanikbacteria bacterium]PIR77268.1 MAG: 50S ribosomal protein L15 [Candidatus Magasanikbacteria bacterium CG10_big_fil_rev_8_21_14_0_10_38_6]
MNSITAHTIETSKGSTRKAKRVGRGNGSGKGTYSARGLKGQRSRSGGKSGNKRRGLKAALQKMPKLRGFKSPHDKKETITLRTLNIICKDGDKVTPFTLKDIGVVGKPDRGVKIVATGELEKKLIITGCHATKQALEKIEKAGGSLSF